MAKKTKKTVAASARVGAKISASATSGSSTDVRLSGVENRLTGVETELKHVAKKEDIERIYAVIESLKTSIEGMKFWVVKAMLTGLATLASLFFAYYQLFGGQ